ncbi:hypothetical protein A3C96_01050 [Candidatus Uhrbacteria bacterium RIFCSPHIGHO2_02_FULL_60_10]|uniref:PRC-barrel domain-containing protein n=1 Tax=Candidatus Uhrbacteria bacterium RIFCSPHIGHO2_02_FULL_60_10 TaxID=1802392 RepID=A0A1F7U2K2_9BACT|nr:MAG: hypothetical protein A3C96_01050 [Candidatus Uhrbacteria bacterium RIFCSPHIGHO2_02_FULL_60_10]
MHLTFVQLKGLPVETRSGQKVGRLAGLSVDSEMHTVARYHVKRTRLLAALLPDELLVDSTQVISLDDKKMVVQDAAVPEMLAARAVRPQEATGAVSAMTAERS